MKKLKMASIGAGIWGENQAHGRCLSIMSNKNSMFCAREIVYSWIIPADAQPVAWPGSLCLDN